MIIARAPLRVTFVGDATDLPDFYRVYPGRVISATIDKYVYLAINESNHADKIIIKYDDICEVVSTADDIRHSRFSKVLDEFKIGKGLELASFADMPGGTGLGSSSTFSVALLAAVNKYSGNSIIPANLAAAACRLEIEQLHEPIGKQDQYAAACGGLNLIEFNSDESVKVSPLAIPDNSSSAIQSHSVLFYLGVTRSAGSVLTEQSAKIKENFETYKKMSDSAFEFQQALVMGDMDKAGAMLSAEWKMKKSLASNVSNNIIDQLYNQGLKSGCLGGKLMGAGSGGCLFFFAKPSQQNSVRADLLALSQELGLVGFKEIPINFVKSGMEIIFNSKLD